jgi:uncharacterized protein
MFLREGCFISVGLFRRVRLEAFWGFAPCFYRTGCCETGPDDIGVHSVCVEVTAAFLTFSRACGNDLSTPRPEFGFPGLEPGDRWCLCAARWRQALEAGAAPRVVLAATHEATLAIVSLADLKRHALDLA